MAKMTASNATTATTIGNMWLVEANPMLDTADFFKASIIESYRHTFGA